MENCYSWYRCYGWQRRYGCFKGKLQEAGAVTKIRGHVFHILSVLKKREKSAGRVFPLDPSIPSTDVACRLGISAAAVYRHSLGGRNAVLKNATNEA